MELATIYLNENMLLQAAREGITKELFMQIVKSTDISIGGFTQMARMTSRTLQRKRQDEKISPESSERAILIGKLYYKGESVFGMKKNFLTWMDRNIPGLNGKKPKELLDTLTGIAMVEDELIRIEHGILS
jgi:putative toxin-antitoxin system antitoxin component (TIGR02293 family)